MALHAKQKKSTVKASNRRFLLSYLTPEEKHKLVGSFVVENFWDTFIKANSESISRFRNIAKKSIPLFIESYQNVWDYVVDINQLDDTFLTESIAANKVLNGLSLNELKIANKLLSLSLYSELEKDCLMALNKTILTELASDLREKYKFTDEEFQLLMTPSFETFFTKYHLDHFEYAVTSDTVLQDKLRKQLISNYHAHDPKLFELRFATMNFPTGSNLVDLLSVQKNSIADKSAKKIAFIGDRKDVKAFEKLLEYDNFLDFKYRYNLQACPEYYLRKVLLSACHLHGIFTDVDKPIALSDSEFIEGVNTLIHLIENKYSIELPAITELMNNSNMKKLRIEGTFLAISSYLKEGSPCVLKNTRKKSYLPENLVIFGYEGDTLLAKTEGKESIKIAAADLKLFDEFTILQKYSDKFLEGMRKSIKRFIDRTPYLERKGYESAF